MVHGSWDIVDLYPCIDNNHIFNEDALTLFLCGHRPYAINTIYNGIQILSERSELEITKNQQEIHFPESSFPFKKRILKENADISIVFMEIIKDSISRYAFYQKENNLACELSGGLDSVLVSVALSEITNKKIYTYCMQLPGEIGAQQMERRQELINKFGFIDTSVLICEHGPLMNNGQSITSGQFSLYDEIYHDALHLMLNQVKASGCTQIMTGIGGDELALSINDAGYVEREKHAQSLDFIVNHKQIPEIYRTQASLPMPAIYSSMIQASQSRATVFLKNNIWPIEPLCYSKLIKFCQYLPNKIKANKKIHKATLANRNISVNFISPKHKENFSGIFENHIRYKCRQQITNIIKNSILHDMGYIYKEKLLERYLTYCATGKSEIDPIIYYIIPAIEYSLLYVNKIKQPHLEREWL